MNEKFRGYVIMSGSRTLVGGCITHKNNDFLDGVLEREINSQFNRKFEEGMKILKYPSDLPGNFDVAPYNALELWDIKCDEDIGF